MLDLEGLNQLLDANLTVLIHDDFLQLSLEHLLELFHLVRVTHDSDRSFEGVPGGHTRPLVLELRSD